MQLILDEIEDVYHRLGEQDADFSEDEKRCSSLPRPEKPHIPA
jgi:hypothetical protein